MGAVSSYATDTADATDFLLGTDSGGTVKRFAMSGLRNVWRTLYEVTVAHTNTSATTSTTITDGTTAWTHTCVAGKSYKFMITGTFQTSLATAGLRLSLLGAGSVAGQVNGAMWGELAQGSVATGLTATLFALGTVATAWPTGSFLLTTAVSPINSPHSFGAEFVFRCTTGGTISIQQAPEVAATSQINVGSAMVVELLN
jgi:hypothetical protein